MLQPFARAFWNPAEGRLRAGWRIALTWALLVVCALPVIGAQKLFFPTWGKHLRIDILLAFVAVIATVIVPFARRWIDRRSVASLGLVRTRAVRDTAAGFVISALLVLIVLGVETAAGGVQFEWVRTDWPSRLGSSLYLLVFSGLVVAWWENLFNVSYVFENLRDGCGFWWAYALNCALFGLLHMANPNASLAAFAGVALIHAYEIYGYLRTRSLWLILGIHAGWNFFQGLAGFPISGSGRNPIVQQLNTTPAWLGGGTFGPEAGLVIVPVAVAAFTLIHLYSQLSGRPGSPLPNRHQKPMLAPIPVPDTRERGGAARRVG
jgi:membrane protease YdiL (CAAX protease family)